jgi:outer membrane immunogenic protein
MKTFKFAALAVLAMLFLTAVAFGQTATWKGLYFGASIGEGLGRSYANTTTVVSDTGYFLSSSLPAIAAVGAQHPRLNGFEHGAQVGYNFQKGRIVYGFEADFVVIKAEGSATGTAVYPEVVTSTFTVTQTVKYRWQVAVRSRVGLSRGKGLYYIVAGLALTELRYQEVFTDTFAWAFETGSFNELLEGWIAGAGLEFRLGRGWSLNGEYSYTDFEQARVTSTNFVAFIPPISYPTSVFTHRADIRSHTIRLGANYRF